MLYCTNATYFVLLIKFKIILVQIVAHLLLQITYLPANKCSFTQIIFAFCTILLYLHSFKIKPKNPFFFFKIYNFLKMSRFLFWFKNNQKERSSNLLKPHFYSTSKLLSQILFQGGPEVVGHGGNNHVFLRLP